MAKQNKGGISWTDQTWSPVTGCTKISAGCAHCYAERMHNRFNKIKPFNEITLHPDRLDQPLHWKKPRMVFVCSVSDLFHEGVPDEFIDKVFAIMALCPQHTFQCLSKRPLRMLKYFNPTSGDPLFTRINDAAWDVTGKTGFALYPTHKHGMVPDRRWPPVNCWLGCTAENQALADERIPLLLKTPAAVHFVSCEPLLENINLRIGYYRCSCGAWERHGNIHQICPDCGKQWIANQKLDLAIVGGESGPGARPCHPDWVRSLRDQCVSAGVPFHFKSWGEWLPFEEATEEQKTLRVSPSSMFCPADDLKPCWLRSGKKNAGCLLDGKIWHQFPRIWEKL
jgi:protein gp37